MSATTNTGMPAWGDQGRVRNWFHTKAGARFLNLQTIWFGIRAPRGYAVLTTTGRRTGKRRRSCLRAIIAADRAIVVATGGRTCDWLRNLEADPNCTLRIGRTSRHGTARLAADQEYAALTDAFCECVELFDRVSSLVNQHGRPDAGRIRKMHERWCREGTIAVIELDTRK